MEPTTIALEKLAQDSAGREQAATPRYPFGDPADWNLGKVLGLTLVVLAKRWRALLAWSLAGTLAWILHPVCFLLVFPVAWGATLQASLDVAEGREESRIGPWWRAVPSLVALSLAQVMAVGALVLVAARGWVLGPAGIQLSHQLTGTTAGDTLAMAGGWLTARATAGPHQGAVWASDAWGPGFLEWPRMLEYGLRDAGLLEVVLLLVLVQLAVAMCFSATAAVAGRGRGARLALCPARWAPLALALFVLRLGGNQAVQELSTLGVRCASACPFTSGLLLHGSLGLWVLGCHLFMVAWALQWLRVESRTRA